MSDPNHEIEVHGSAPSLHSCASRKTIAEPTGSTQILHKPQEREHSTDSKNSLSGFGSKLRHIPQYFLGFLLLVLVAFQAWTYYLGTTDVTFERLTGSKPYPEVEEISLRRYKKGTISPHLFTIKSANETALLKHLEEDCRLKKISFSEIPREASKTDSEMVDVIKDSPYIYLSRSYDLTNPKAGRMCLVFRDKERIYLFVNGNL